MADQEDGGLSRREFVRGALATTVTLSVACSGPRMGADAGDIDGGGMDGGADASVGTDSGTDAGTDAGPEPVDPPEGVMESTVDFPLGVASGDVTSTSAIFWTSYVGAGAIELVVWEMDGSTYARTVHVGEVLPSPYVHEDVGVLEPAKRYRYTFFVVESGVRTLRSRIGRLRAAFADDSMGTLWVGASSCTQNTHGIEPLGQAAVRDDLDLFVFLGDTSYNDGATSPAEYRAKWEQQLARPEYQALRASTSALATWDDHEFDNNWDPETFDAAQLDAATQSFFDHQPLRRDSAAPNRVWKKMRWGRTAELFVLDCRSERRPSSRGAEDEYISREQMDWLKAELASSDAVFKLILNTVPISDFPGVFDLARNDRWEGYPTQRDEILRHIDDSAITGVLWVAGDFHLASAGRVATSGAGANQVEVLVGPGGHSANPLSFTLGGPQFDFASGTNNFTALELLPTMGRVRAWWVDGSGSNFEVHEYDVG